MAHLCSLRKYTVIGCKQFLRVFSLEDGSCVFTYTHKFDKAITDGSNKPLDDRLEDLCTSTDEKYICAIYSDKRLIVVALDNAWTLTKVIKVKRRPTAMCFDPSGELLFVADKSGDLYRYVLKDEIDIVDESESEDMTKKFKEFDPILGHVSMLLDVKVTADGKYILTADRDEKIRVSDLKKPYVIEGFCLGHTEFVCTIETVPCEGTSLLILSSSGDGTVRMWDVITGRECDKYEFNCSARDGDENEESNLKKQFIPSVLTCSSSGLHFVVASSQNDSAVVSVFSINVDMASFTHCRDFNIPNFDKIEDLKFGRNNDDDGFLYILGTSKINGNLELCSYKQNDLFTSSDLPCLEVINSNLCDVISEVNCLYQPLFKIRGDGEAYVSYQKKKEERLMAKFQINLNQAKRVKMDANS